MLRTSHELPHKSNTTIAMLTYHFMIKTYSYKIFAASLVSGVARLVSLAGHLTVLLQYYNPMTVLLEYIDLLFKERARPSPPLATPLSLVYYFTRNKRTTTKN